RKGTTGHPGAEAIRRRVVIGVAPVLRIRVGDVSSVAQPTQGTAQRSPRASAGISPSRSAKARSRTGAGVEPAPSWGNAGAKGVNGPMPSAGFRASSDGTGADGAGREAAGRAPTEGTAGERAAGCVRTAAEVGLASASLPFPP